MFQSGGAIIGSFLFGAYLFPGRPMAVLRIRLRRLGRGIAVEI